MSMDAFYSLLIDTEKEKLTPVELVNIVGKYGQREAFTMPNIFEGDISCDFSFNGFATSAQNSVSPTPCI